ncbi:4Fe-4S dicluster domain-containing protein [uncultured Pseudodesulfovibrio sp.]|uniref:4Fe-4S dicluster domain-containing protein n=1 Tax=uncultured Pseudodesulfovibrio sp. TaxID=2035858 RepID=UPI0029C7D371|nr:4Fe-4S dicluster domain-containing protein [uncultured Pseudodesulfovibrio sp.]
MLRINYSLKSDSRQPITDVPMPAELNMRIRNLVLKTGKGKQVECGEIIAEHPSQSGGASHAAASGRTQVVNYHHLTIQCDGEGRSVSPVDVASMGPGKQLLRTLQRLGIDVTPLGRASLLVVNGLNPEPGISVAGYLLENEREVLKVGLKLAKKLIVPVRTVLAAPSSSCFLTGTETMKVKPKYPASLNVLTVKAVTGKEYPENTQVMSLMDLYELGRVALTGLPLTSTIMTIKGHNYRVPIGTPIRHLLGIMDIPVSNGDTVILGGPFRGEAVYCLDEGVSKRSYGLFVISRGEFPPIEDATCINCGECVLNCPGRIQPNLISRYAEFEMFEMAEKHGLHSCLECGLCSFNCTARRPLLQYIRLAKEQLLSSGRTPTQA